MNNIDGFFFICITILSKYAKNKQNKYENVTLFSFVLQSTRIQQPVRFIHCKIYREYYKILFILFIRSIKRTFKKDISV